MRLRAEQRLRRQLDFKHARERGRRHDAGAFTIWAARREPASPDATACRDPLIEPFANIGSRVGVVASRAGVGNAVQRNRAKRRLRDTYRRHQHLVPGDCDLLLVARQVLNRLESGEIDRRFVSACHKLFPPTQRDA